MSTVKLASTMDRTKVGLRTQSARAARLLRAQYPDADLAVQVLIGARHVAAAKPHPEGAVGHLFHARVTHDLSVPLLHSGDDKVRNACPVNAVGRLCQPEAALLTLISAGVEHPPLAAGGPHSGLAQAVFVESSRGAGFENRI